jgi:hypothetical protein
MIDAARVSEPFILWLLQYKEEEEEEEEERVEVNLLPKRIAT